MLALVSVVAVTEMGVPLLRIAQTLASHLYDTLTLMAQDFDR